MNNFKLSETNIELHVTDFLKSFTSKMNQCDNTEDYFELVVSVLTFLKLVRSDFINNPQSDDINVTPELISTLENLASSISKRIEASTNENPSPAELVHVNKSLLN